MNINDFDYHLPTRLIAQTPVEPRSQSRLMVLHRDSMSIEHHNFHEIPNYLHEGDTLVFNNSRVIPARLSGQKSDSTTKIEILLLRRLDIGIWETLVHPGKKMTIGTKVNITSKRASNGKGCLAEVLEYGENGIRIIRFSNESLLEELGEVPLPPYIHTPLAEPERYQTVYAKIKGSVAAPTAGLHFVPELLHDLRKKEIQSAFITLHIGLDTFRPVRVEDPHQHPIHKEYGEISSETAALLNNAKKEGRRIIAVGTSTIRLIEAATKDGIIQPFGGWVSLFILPGYRFSITDAIITNFHLPKSTLLMLVSAFASRDFIFQAYEQAKNLGYHFYSFGDAMLIL